MTDDKPPYEGERTVFQRTKPTSKPAAGPAVPPARTPSPQGGTAAPPPAAPPVHAFDRSVSPPPQDADRPAARPVGSMSQPAIAESGNDALSPAQRAAPDDVPPLPIKASVRNPVMTAAIKLLSIGGALRLLNSPQEIMSLGQEARREAILFEQQLAAINLSPEDNAKARYGVLATIDDLIQNAPGGVGQEWARSSLVVSSFQQAFGGEQFFHILDEMLQKPAQYADILEVYQACLAIGFEGKLRHIGGGQAKAQEYIASILAALTNVRPRPENDISPHWRGEAKAMARLGVASRLAAIAAAAAGLSALIFAVYFFVLNSRDAPIAAALRAIPPVEDARIAGRDGAFEISRTGQFERIRARIDHPCIESSEDGRFIRLTIAVCPELPVALFSRGASQISGPFRPVLEEAGAALASEAGAIRVVAHTDSDPIGVGLLSRFPDNQSLSEERARSAVRVLNNTITDATRLSPEGRGATEPRNRANTTEAKAENRRVELILPRSQ